MPVTGTLGAGPNLPPKQKSDITSAMLLMVTAMMFLPLMDVFSKILTTRYTISPVMVTFIRFAGQAFLLGLVIILFRGWRTLKGPHVGINVLRGMLVGAAVSNFFIAVKYLPLADAISIFFVEPLIVLLLSSIFLGERVGWRRGTAAIFGFCGALFIIQPTYAIFGAKALLPLVTACLFAVYLILSRKVGQSDHPFTMQFWSGIGGIVICGIFLLVGGPLGFADFAFTVPGVTPEFLYLAAIILIATVGHLLIVVAFSRAEASILAPFQYLEIVTMTVAGYLIFADFPSATKWTGIAMIISSGLYIFMRERRIEKSG